MEENKEIRTYEDKFLPGSQEILAVTGANGFGGGRTGGESLWTASIDLVAWKDGSGALHREEWTLTAKADDEALARLRKAAGPNSVIRARVRRWDGDRCCFLLEGLPQAAADPELEGILAELLKPVYYDDPELGRFTLDRQVNTFDGEAEWMGQKVTLTFDWDEEEAMADSIKTARALFRDQEGWTRRVLAQASRDLLELKNDCWLGEDEEELTAEEFQSRLVLGTIEVRPEGEFCFWFGDGEIFWGHTVTVEGTLEDGPTEAEMMG